jgi:hypothetical protein
MTPTPDLGLVSLEIFRKMEWKTECPVLVVNLLYDELIIFDHCLKVHCTKGQVANDAKLGG